MKKILLLSVSTVIASSLYASIASAQSEFKDVVYIHPLLTDEQYVDPNVDVKPMIDYLEITRNVEITSVVQINNKDETLFVEDASGKYVLKGEQVSELRSLVGKKVKIVGKVPDFRYFKKPEFEYLTVTKYIIEDDDQRITIKGKVLKHVVEGKKQYELVARNNSYILSGDVDWSVWTNDFVYATGKLKNGGESFIFNVDKVLKVNKNMIQVVGEVKNRGDKYELVSEHNEVYILNSNMIDFSEYVGQQVEIQGERAMFKVRRLFPANSPIPVYVETISNVTTDLNRLEEQMWLQRFI